MTDAPIALTVHPGGGVPQKGQRLLIAEWLKSNGINPDLVAADTPITVLTVPHPVEDPTEPLFIQVIVFSQYYADHAGSKEANLITRQAVTFQRTVPLAVLFPTDLPDEAEDGHAARAPEGEQQQEEAGAQ